MTFHSKRREFSIGDNVFAFIHAKNSQTWLPETLTAITGPLSYVVHLDDGRTQRYHIHQLRARHSNAPQTEINIPGNVFVPTIPDNVTSASKETTPVAPVLNREPIAYTHVATAITETSRHTAGVQYERLIIYIDNQSHY